MLTSESGGGELEIFLERMTGEMEFGMETAAVMPHSRTRVVIIWIRYYLYSEKFVY